MPRRSSRTEMWDQLPELILTRIFGHLDRADRASVGRVCRTWGRALSSPALWRSVSVLIDRDLRGDFPLAEEFAVRETFLSLPRELFISHSETRGK